MSFVSEIEVGSLLVYPKGNSLASQQARSFIRYDVKRARAGRIEYCAEKLRELLEGSVLEELLSDAGLLVPVPGHAPRYEGGLWVADRIAQAIRGQGIGEEVQPLLRRTEAVPRSSSLTAAEERPDPVRHYETIEVESLLAGPNRITLVDDVVTRGSTLIGSATRLRERFPDAEIRAFALARVDSQDLGDVKEMLSPGLETVRYDEGSGFVKRS